MRQTGGDSGYIDPADKLYDAIRVSETGVGTIAANTGIKSQKIQKVKDHAFHNEHLLDKYVDYGVPAECAKFDSNLNQAAAWKRLENGKVAVMGRAMGNDKINCVRDYPAALQKQGCDIELFNGGYDSSFSTERV